MTMMKLKSRFILLGIFAFIVLWGLLKLSNSNETLKLRSNMINLNELNYMGECLLREAGKEIVRIRQENSNADARFDMKKKADNSVVTKADLRSHTIIVHTLEHKYPRLKINSEENGGADLSRDELETYLATCDRYEKRDSDLFANIDEINVWVDPLDATQEYSENLVDYVTVMFCIVKRNIPRAGIIYKPFSKYSVSSFFEEKNLKEKSQYPIKNRIVVSRSHSGEVKSLISEKLKNSEIIIAAGSGYKTLSLLSDNADLYLHSSKIYKWDICAPNAILNNLGGKLTKRNGEQVDYMSDKTERNSVDGIIASLNYYDFYLSIFKKLV